MAFVVTVPNPFQPVTGVQKDVIAGGISINEYLRQIRPGKGPNGWREFELPTICVLNGEPVLRGKKNPGDPNEPSPGWDKIICDSDVLNIMTVPQGPFIIIALIIVVVAVAVTLAFSAMVPKAPGELPASDPVFSTRGQYNQIRLGEPIEVCYGRNRMYPSLAARPFFQYIDNDQFQYVLFCLGQGQFDIEQILIGDTDIDDFQEVQYEVIPPGGLVTLFPTNVITSVEVGGQTLFGTNEADYVPTQGWVGPFNANPAGTLATKLQIDVVFPKGLYSVDKKGNLNGISIGLQWQAREIDDLGNPVGSFFNLFAPSPKIVSGATTTPQRRSYTATVTPGRYEVRLRRTNSFDPSYKVGNEAIWEGMRSQIETTQDWGDVTLMAVKIRATNNLNERTQQRFNVIATRKLPTYNGTSWTAPVATRSIIWSFADVFRSSYGGRIFDDGYLDLSAFVDLDELYADRNEFFDWIFRDPITVWDASQAIAQVGRAVPLLAGSQVTIRRQGPLLVPVTAFTKDNIHKGTFKWEIKLWDVDEHDCLAVEYTEPETGYKQEIVICVLPGGTTNNPKNVRLIGIQDRAHAYHQGMFILAAEKYVREQISFATGLEGHIPSYGDLVAIVHDVPKWGQSGFIVHAQTGAGSYKHLWVSEPLVWETDNINHVIMLRGRKSELLGPFEAIQTDDSKQVIIIAPGAIDFMLDGSTEPMLFYFGITGEITKHFKIARLEPRADDEIDVTAVEDAPIIHSFDELEAPPLAELVLPPVPPDLPVVAQVYITQISDVQSIVQIAWTAAFGAQYYVVQTSEDNAIWTDRGTTVQTSIQLQVRPGQLYVRVAGVNNGQGPWALADTSIGVVTGLDTEIPWEFLEYRLSWFQVLNAISYTVRIYDNTDPLVPILKRTTTGITDLIFDYHYNPEGIADGNLKRNHLATVDAVFDDGPANLPTPLTLFNSIPLPPENPAHLFLEVDTDFNAVYRISWEVPEEDDLIRVKVWVSDDPLFNPDLTVPVFDYTHPTPGFATIPVETEVEIPLDTDGEHLPMYYRIALFDVWGNEIETNITEVQTIPAYP